MFIVASILAFLYVLAWLIGFRISFTDLKRSHIQPNYNQAPRPVQIYEGKITINFSSCNQDRIRIDIPFGSITIAVEGKKNDVCRLYYGGEVENPSWDGSLPVVCDVPTELGIVTFERDGFGFSFEQISQYCES